MVERRVPTTEKVGELIADHKGDASAHHARYADAEAVTAMGAKADANPLHHDKAEEWGAAEHTAIGDNAPHHAKTTSASELTSGVLPSVDRLPALTNTKIWQGNATNRPVEVDMPAAGATKEFFVPVTQGTNPTYLGNHSGILIDSGTGIAYIEFRVPHDYSSLTEIVVVKIAGATGTHRLNYEAHAGAVGEKYWTHSKDLLDHDTAETSQYIYEQSLDAMFDGMGQIVLAAGDYVGIRVYGDDTNTPNDLIVGIRFKYS